MARHRMDSEQIPSDISSPQILFKNWYSRFYTPHSPNRDGVVAILSTIQPNNTPHSRAVYIYNINYDYNNTCNFSFITNILTSKCNDIQYNSHVSLLFLWKEHQIIVNGTATICNAETNNKIWNSRTDIQHKNSWNNYRCHNNIVPIPVDSTQLESNIIESISQLKLRLPIVPNWGSIYIIPRTYDFSYEGILLSRVRIHYYIDENNIWQRKNALLNIMGCTEGSEFIEKQKSGGGNNYSQ